MKAKLFKHQQDIVNLSPDKHILVFGTGTGKTITAIEWANKKKAGVLIIVPKGLKTQWENEVIKWELEVPYLIVTKEEFKKQLKTLPRFYSVIVDECHYFHGMKSALSKSLLAYFKVYKVPHRLLCSATPFRSSPWDIYRLMELLDYKERPSYSYFNNKCFYMVRMGPRMIPQARKGIEPLLASYVQQIGSIVKLEDCIDVPEQIFEVEYFSLTSDQIKGMKEAWDPLPIVRFTKEHQICGGTLKGDEYNKAKTFKSDKLERLEELVEQNNKLIVVCRYNHEIQVIRELLESKQTHKVEVINGEIPPEERSNILSSLKESDKYVLIVNSACAEGWELSDCPLMIFYSMDFSLLKYIQMLGRIQRINNIKKNTYMFLLIKDSIDEDIFKTVIINKMDFHLNIYSATE